jgi:hypothetical protein
VAALERPRKGLLRQVEGKLTICACANECSNEPGDVPVVDHDDRLRVAPQAAQRLGVGERAHTW